MSSFKPGQRADEVDASQEVAGGFLVAGSDATEVFDGIEEALDQIALGIKRIVALSLGFAVGLWRDDGGDGAHFEAFDKAVSVVSLIGDHGVRLGLGRQRFSLGDVVGLAAGEADREGISQGIDDDMDFRRQSAARPADGLIGAPFLRAPALC